MNENNVNVGTWSVGEVKAKDGRDLTFKSIDLHQEYIIVDGVRNEFPNSNYLTQLVILEEKEDVLGVYNMMVGINLLRRMAKKGFRFSKFLKNRPVYKNFLIGENERL